MGQAGSLRKSQIIHWPVNRTEPFSYWIPCRGDGAETAAAGARCARRFPNPTELPFWPKPKTGRSAVERTRSLPAACIQRPTARPFSPALRTPIVPPPAAPRDGPPAGPPFPLRNGPPAARSPSAPGSTRVVLTSHGKAGFHPGPGRVGVSSRRSFCAAATPNGSSEFAQRLEWASLLALSDFRTAAADLLLHPIFQTRSTPDPIPSSPDDTDPQRARFQPGPGRVYPNRRPRPEDRKAPPAEFLALGARRGGRWQAENRNPPASRSVPIKRVQFTFRTTLHIPALCAGQSRGNIEEEWVSLGLSAAGAEKAKYAVNWTVVRPCIEPPQLPSMKREAV